MTKAINIVIENTLNPTFIDIEDDNGKSINIGTRSIIDDLIKIRITAEDIENFISKKCVCENCTCVKE